MTDIPPVELTVAATLVDDPSVSLLTPWLTEEHFTSPVCRAALTVARKAAATCAGLGTTASFVDTHIACKELGESRWWPAFIEIQGHGCVPELFMFYAAKLTPEHLRRQGEQAVVTGSQHLRAATDDASVRQALTGLAHRLLDVSADAEAAVDAETVADLLARPRREQDWLVPDLLERQDRVLVVAGEGSGKALNINTPLPTPSGWTTMGAVAVGDHLLGGGGHPCRVTAVTNVTVHSSAWTVRFHDGTTLHADADHRWVTVDYRARQRGGGHVRGVVTTRELRASMHHMVSGEARANHAVPVAGELDLPDVELPIAPYTLGVWLGDGTTASGQVTLSDRDGDVIRSGIRSEGYGFTVGRQESGCRTQTILALQPILRRRLLLGNKHIPNLYLRAGTQQRRALLCGLMDTDGTINAAGTGCELTFTCKSLVDGAAELIRTLGMRVSVAESDAKLNGRVVGRRWRMTFTAPFNPFTVAWKADRWKPLRTQRSQYRYIVAVEPASAALMRCVGVDSPDRTYLAGTEMVPTHNSTLARQVAAACARGLHPFAGGLTIPRPLQVLVVDLENPEGVQHRAWQRLTRCDPHSGHDGWQQRLHLWRRPGGIDLRLPRDAAQLEARAAACSPDLMVFGPLYKSYRAREDRANDAAGEAAAVLDRIRERHGCALWLETHAPLAHAGGKRDLRPVDAGLWLRWPEFGLALRQEDGFAGRRRLAVERFRGDRDRADWPDALYEGATDEWPWLGEWAAGGPGMRDMT